MTAPDERPDVSLDPAVAVDLRIERVTDTAGCRLTGGSGASCWGYNQSNLVRHGEDLYALSWRDDLTVAVYHRTGPDAWTPGPVLPPVPQNGNLLIDPAGRLHVISGDRASWHVVFDEPGRLDRWELRRRVAADSRFGAAIDATGRLLVAGGLEEMAWYILDTMGPDVPLAHGTVTHPAARGYHIVHWRDGEAFALCSDDYFLAGERYPNQQVVLPDPATGGTRTVETPRGIYPVLRAYLLHNPDPLADPAGWTTTTISNVSDTFDEAAGTRGTTDHQDLLVDDDGAVHLLYYENRQPSGSVWAGTDQHDDEARLYHAWRRPGEGFRHTCLGHYHGGRLHRDASGRLHALLISGRRSAARAVHHALLDDGGERMSTPTGLDGLGPLWHLFVASRRAGSAPGPGLDLYWTGPLGGNSNELFYGHLTVG
jgi:hypothetical protein